ncbi:enolase C-terminal domain-like protein [Bartonella doshiae]|uniref:L-Ala-D/L-Glu epimerase n=2 Tax=Bartonella doshiae TaxID=33044 RepID=A0A380ZFS4_BARDO|nr:enolase C-terminal domain-like protein [Bartonella doshiae]EJF79641.1 hypothetical protein MCS_01368 [Bartonella doshiae NCTC 12862 = ATCC 700133]MBB6160076.1 L-alanine-DL-glutamate epimerase-like enolase superfamily enzyme [Bartonella doshiae]SUV45390.1 L-Ala-D/L-Glu epimerase [Bartonella doshiae]
MTYLNTIKVTNIHTEIINRPLTYPFRIAGEVHYDVLTLTVILEHKGIIGRGECNPYSVRGHNLESVQAEIEAVRKLLLCGINRIALLEVMYPGPARNAIDCALIDLECKILQTPVNKLLGIETSREICTAQTIGILQNNKELDYFTDKQLPIIKLKVDNSTSTSVISKVKDVFPNTQLIVDANGSLNVSLSEWLYELNNNSVKVLEQPVPFGNEDLLLQVKRGSVLICADESFLNVNHFDIALKYYDMINIKLDKIGGVTAALNAIQIAKANGLQVLIGCMLGTSLSAAPCWWLAQKGDLIDLDGPTMLSQDIDNAMVWSSGRISKPKKELWG